MHQRLHHLSGRGHGENHMSGVRRESIQEREERTSKSGVVLSYHSSSAALFRGPKEAKLIRWHAERKNPEDVDDDPEKDDLLTHPPDASQWKALDLEFPEFGGDPRNIRLGASTDGLNPF